ncbi:hypothetical protein K505DRAFT_420514 [Melanomma pulvis-pyrius CBS 109.77]|uniref:BZIP domain-containing protein n=1 Tax=Melanomma pulvis-pyrius CBS 109.77 TaxID=1314802 RepID=A0A6A6WZP8_9PLEO|nr:hypothetical protein K505DRAFT_420514 [Melanomma pulvis-pyrius CBS 109.77]
MLGNMDAALQRGNRRRPYKRKLTEKRRAQNRVAQQTYREKRKKRLEIAEKADATSLTSNEKTERHATSNVSSRSHATSSYDFSDTSFEDSICHIAETNIEDHEGGRADSSASSINIFTPLQSTEIPKKGIGTINTDVSVSESLSPNMCTIDVVKHVLEQEPGDDVDGLMDFAITKQLDLKTIILAGLKALAPQKGSSVVCQIVDPGPGRSPSSQTSHQPVFPSPDVVPFLPSPLGNGISLRRQALREVYYQNAQAIGLSLEDIMLPGCSSPFSAPLSTPLTSIPASSVPPDLRPTPSQLQFSHHAFIDLIPFPWFRDRVIVLSSLDPPAFDRAELKLDILNGGLVCWKSRARGAGQPWDRRSWEIAPWFLEKWGWLIEERRQVEEQSRWWRELRGE